MHKSVGAYECYIESLKFMLAVYNNMPRPIDIFNASKFSQTELSIIVLSNII